MTESEAAAVEATKEEVSEINILSLPFDWFSVSMEGFGLVAGLHWYVNLQFDVYTPRESFTSNISR